jgi:two-component system, chemotaxis family, chemotaxis protein CheY
MKKIAVIDDDTIFQMVIDRLISKNKLPGTVVPLENCFAALDYLHKNIELPDELPDIILLDINLPRLDGWDFLTEFEKLKARIKKEIVIYMLSSSINDEDRLRAESNSLIMAYIIKPISLEKLQMVINGFPERRL